MTTITAIRRTGCGTPFRQPGALNLHVAVPCPLKVRLQAALGAFIDDYNRRHSQPIYCPSILDGEPHGIDELMQRSQHIDELPEIWVSIGLHTMHGLTNESADAMLGVLQAVRGGGLVSGLR